MATNSARGNSIGADDGPAPQNVQTVPAVPDSLKAAIHNHDLTGAHAAGQDAGAVPGGVPTVEKKPGDALTHDNDGRWLDV
ncbi:hypothetical protein B0T22DRAFT_478029 [Podospora appendiculata]|uniref:Uncharacterized protein n=1 Tax=Podospora appendiculata TaxID=314037 RepID=A0AAE0XKZ7_9PEZI|nr:hypothetical protein B0T22DRAFT_478029 [Podospora appendiculata]